jgi:hypothetical protein
MSERFGGGKIRREGGRWSWDEHDDLGSRAVERKSFSVRMIDAIDRGFVTCTELAA